MATIIDSFIVELGIDPTKFDAQQKKVVSSFKKNQDELESRAKNTEKAADEVGGSIAGLARQASGFFAAIGAGKFLTSFTTDAIRAGAETNRLTNTIGASVETLSKWQGLARVFGGDAGAMASSFTTLSDAFAGWKIGKVSPIIADFRAISTAGGVIIDMNKGVEQSILDLAENLKNIAAGPGGKETAGLLGRQLGLDPATISMLMQGSARVKEELSKIQGMTKEGAQAADDLDRSWNALILTLRNWGQAKVLELAPGFKEQLEHEMRDLKALGGLWGKVQSLWGGGGNTANAAPAPAGPGFSADSLRSGGAGAFKSQDEKAEFIKQVARKNGIDPEVALRVSKTEGFNSYVGDRNSSFGAFQLHYGGVAPGMMQGGLGDKFTKDTGLNARDPATEKQQIEFALKYAATSGRGWADWFGARNNGIGQYAGITPGGGSQTTTVENLIVNVPAGSDGAKIAEETRAALTRRTSAAANANSGGH